jgi:hypothetical protein
MNEIKFIGGIVSVVNLVEPLIRMLGKLVGYTWAEKKCGQR